MGSACVGKLKNKIKGKVKREAESNKNTRFITSEYRLFLKLQCKIAHSLSSHGGKEPVGGTCPFSAAIFLIWTFDCTRLQA